jgi:tetratricopeptide (TPR) repeat protein
MSAHISRSPSASRILDRVVRFLVLALVAAIVGFAAFYYADRQVKPAPSLLEQAIVQAEEAVRQNPDHAGRRIAVASLYVDSGRFDEAVIQFRAALEIDKSALAAHYGLGIVYLDRRQYSLAEEEFTRVVDSRGDSEFSVADRALQAAYFHLARAQIGQQKLDAAIFTLEKAVTIDRTDADSWELLGSAYLASGKPDQAIVALERAVLFVPDSPEAFSMLVKAYQATGNERGARHAQAMVHFGQKDFERAVVELTALIEAQPDDAIAWTRLGFVYEAQGMKRNAAEAYERALAVNPEEFNARQGISRVGTNPGR